MRLSLYPVCVFAICCSICLLACGSPADISEQEVLSEPLPSYTAISLLGDTLTSATPSKKIRERATLAAAVYEQNPDDPEALIWHGRWTAYQGDYPAAIAIFSEGIKRFPDDPRMYRHRGHRYISIRAFDLAEIDFKKAWSLTEGDLDQIEPDGMPNPDFIPVSTLQSNILYHLGLALYLQNKLPEAVEVYQEDLARGGNNDQQVSTLHWLYMSLRMLGRDDEAARMLDQVEATTPIVENKDYLRLCLFYKGQINEEELLPSAETGPAGDAVLYGLANWHFYNGKREKAKEMLEMIIMGKQWNSFGHIAAEAQYMRVFANAK